MNDRETYHHGNLRAALLESALAILIESGVEGLSLRAVARRAGVSTAAPYNHFADKQAILRELAHSQRLKSNQVFITAIENAGTPRAKLKALGTAYVSYALEHQAEFNFTFGGSFAPYLEGEPQDGPLLDLLKETVETANNSLSAADLDTAVIMVWSLIHGLAQLLVSGPFSKLGRDSRQEDSLVDRVMDQLGRLLELKA